MTRRHRASATALALPLAAAAALLGVLLAGAAPALAADRIDTVAGSGTNGFAGDGGFATSALLTSPSGLAPLGEGYLIADTANNRIRRVDAAGVITTIAGAGPCCGTSEPFAGERIAATDPTVRLNQPRDVAIAADGGVLIADTDNHRIRRIDPAGTITTVAGTGTPGFGTGDGATTVNLRSPGGVAALPDGGFLIADTGNNRIARVLPGGLLTTVAGLPSNTLLGDGGPATAAGLNAPARVVPLTGGGYLIADSGNNRIRRVDTGDTITTVAGSAATGFSGDGGPATQAALNGPEGVAVRDDGSLVIADSTNERIREVDRDGTIRTIAGTGTLGLSGDGGPPTAAQLSHPRAVLLDGARIRIADAFNHRVRAIAPEPVGRAPDPVPDPPIDTTPPRAIPPGVAPPVRGSSAVVAPVSGTVLIRLPGTRRFVALDALANIPLGAELDARAGRVSLQFVTTGSGRTASAVAAGGRFVVRQSGALDRGQLPGTLLLSGPLTGCAPAAASKRLARSAAKRKRGKGRKGRRVDVEAEGRIRTQGRYGAAIVRGTRWTIVDRCASDPRPGTFVRVRRGKVAVTAFRLRRTVLVRAGRSFLAPARAPRRVR
jgi:sugar lactone lactonase YvrE